MWVLAAGASARCMPVRCRLGGSGDFGGRPGQPQRLIIPGQQDSGPPRQGGGLIIPNQSGTGASSGLSGGVGLSGVGPVQQNFRPPPGFMDVDKPEDAGAPSGMDANQMLDRLRAQAGPWHELAKLFQLLQGLGYDSSAVEEATGLERKEQALWASSAQVYESIKRSGKLSPQQLSYYDVDGATLLNELRLLSIAQRAQAAAYIADQQLSTQEAQVVARAIKEHERRDGKKEGFSNSPADCLAYKFFRDAQETRKKDDFEAYIAKALAVADTEEAIAKLKSMLGEEQVQGAGLPTATLTMLRLNREEVGFRPIPVAGELGSLSAAPLRAAPKVASSGPFSVFRVPPEGQASDWVAMPSWSAVLLAEHPVALAVPNCSDVPQVITSSAAKTEEEVRRLAGPGLLVVEAARPSQEPKPDRYYLVAAGDTALRLEEGSKVSGEVVAEVLFLVRPPARDTAAAGTSELLSL